MIHTSRLKTTFALINVALLLATIFAAAGVEAETRRIRFGRGRTTVVLKGAIVRGTDDRYRLRASVGQTMSVHITSVENNASFEIFAPRSGRSLAGVSNDWSGKLPRSGDYTIVVYSERGNAEYTLEVTVR
jgi:hypothetical protein